ncbi:hypothetical protein GQ600_3805 [Phytophthora cactorum]|nr:hypothetical protein GQ600_3805 [Phytophthora cactorum]
MNHDFHVFCVMLLNIIFTIPSPPSSKLRSCLQTLRPRLLTPVRRIEYRRQSPYKGRWATRRLDELGDHPENTRRIHTCQYDESKVCRFECSFILGNRNPHVGRVSLDKLVNYHPHGFAKQVSSLERGLRSLIAQNFAHTVVGNESHIGQHKRRSADCHSDIFTCGTGRSVANTFDGSADTICEALELKPTRRVGVEEVLDFDHRRFIWRVERADISEKSHHVSRR